jgi:hypothetical protein
VYFDIHSSLLQHSLNCIATTRDKHNICTTIVFLLKNSSAIRRTMLQFRENTGTPENNFKLFFFLFAEKELGSALKKIGLVGKLETQILFCMALP